MTKYTTVLNKLFHLIMTDTMSDGLTSSTADAFTSHQKFFIMNVDKSVGAQYLKGCMCLDPSLQVHIHVDRQGRSLECAEVLVPKTLIKEVLQMDGMLLKGKTLSVKKPETMHKAILSRWKKNEEGVVFCGSQYSESVERMAKAEMKLLYHMTDAGAYLTDQNFTAKKDVDEVINRAFLSGVEKIVVKALTVRQAMKAQTLADAYPGIIYFTAGVHPMNEITWKGETTLQRLRGLLAHPGCVALGEIGLDKDETVTQRDMFSSQVKLACDMDMPLVLCDGGKSETIHNILTEFKDQLPPVCVKGDRLTSSALQTFHDMGCYISLTGYAWTTPYKAGPRDWLSSVSHDVDNTRLLLASDSPGKFPNFLSKFTAATRSYHAALYKVDCLNMTEACQQQTVKYCSKRNEPFSVHSILELASGGVQRTPHKLAAIVRKNAYRFYSFAEKSERKWSECSKQEVTSEVVDLQTAKRRNYVSTGLSLTLAVLLVVILLTFQHVWKLDSMSE
ncbi:3'-5' ssDNA/RNA exonuclease TatD-like [Haliotis cracherodii]|uniref:3'-5' ssDNA/RNA exonuclease TatD-like n=1 Tax=Haliotis cracherodii TaxID=6455 RepID=UPI0039EC8ECB